MRALDLFSGIGGMTRALEGLADTVAYVEVDPACRQVLQARMEDGRLPRAPVLGDVRTVTAGSADLEGPIDLITAGWPCQDLSSMGLRKGLDGARSGLIREVLRLVDELQPRAVFLENVPTVVAYGLDFIVAEFVHKRGYQLRWCVLPASAVGAPHTRKRWFGLALKPGLDLPSGETQRRTWGPTEWGREPVQRLVLPRDAAHRHECRARFAMLGNSMVPEAVRAAFKQLVTAFEGQPLRPVRAYATWGAATVDGLLWELEGGPPRLEAPKASLDITLDPLAYTKREKCRKVGAEALSQPVSLRAWPTLRHLGFGPASHVLTARSRKDLPTALRFAADTPDHLRDGVINPEFAEWMMGFPSGWTAH